MKVIKRLTIILNMYIFVFNIFSHNVFSLDLSTKKSEGNAVVSELNNDKKSEGNAVDSESNNDKKSEGNAVDSELNNDKKSEGNAVDSELNNDKKSEGNAVDSELNNDKKSEGNAVDSESNNDKKSEGNAVDSELNNDKKSEGNAVDSELNNDKKEKELKINIPDVNLRHALNKIIDPKRDINSPININELESLRGNLNLDRKGIEDITGIQYCTNITNLDLRTNRISDLKPLSNLKKLKILMIYDNNISSLEPLRNLTNLQELWTSSNSISDLSPLSNLKNLMYLDASNQKIKHTGIKIEGSTLTVENNIIGVDGKPLEIYSDSNYTYDANTNKVTFNNITEPGEQSYSFDTFMDLGKMFSGTVTYDVTFETNDISVSVPTSMTFDVITNTIDGNPILASAEYQITNKSNFDVNVSGVYEESYTGDIKLVDSVNKNNKDDLIELSLNLDYGENKDNINEIFINNVKNLSKSYGDITIKNNNSIYLKFSSDELGMSDIKQEAMKGTFANSKKITKGKLILTFSSKR